MDEAKHIPVLLEESVEYLLNGRKTGTYIDATLGGGGHSEKILMQLGKTGDARLIGIDQDPIAIEAATRRLSSYPNFKAVRANFRELDEVLEKLEIGEIDGILLDLGLSSMQLDSETRGFSFRFDSRLDMRMDSDETGTTAMELLETLDEKALRKLFQEFGEDRWAGRVASKIVKARQTQSIETTAQLAQLIADSIPKRFHSRRIHPATRFFQALRIAVNEELEALEEALEKSVKALAKSGRIVIISYHSLEDRIVKHRFREMASEEILTVVTKKPVLPTPEEIEINPRSRSAKMRVAEKK